MWYSTLKYFSKACWQLSLVVFVGLRGVLLKVTKQSTLYLRILTVVICAGETAQGQSYSEG